MVHKDQKKSNHQNDCKSCALYKKGGVDALDICMWWDKPKEIPEEILDKGCNFWRDDWAQYIIDKFDGELIITRRSKCLK